MALNIKPVSGMPPEQVRLRLRTKLKELAQRSLSGGGGGDTSHASYIDYYARHGNDSLAALSQRLETIRGLVAELREAAPHRKPAEIRGIATRITTQLSSVEIQRNRTRENIESLANVGKQAAAGLSDAKTKTLIRDAYALVQALPVISNPPVGQEGNTIRAIAAILKAHFGLLDGDVRPIPIQGAQERIEEFLLQIVQAYKTDSVNSAEVNAALDNAAVETVSEQDEDPDEDPEYEPEDE